MEFGEDLFEALFGARGDRVDGPLRGRDREALLELSLEDALAGGRRRLTLDGREVSVNFPAGVRDRQLIRLAGQGGEGRGGGSGHLQAIVKIVVPKELSDRERELYEQLAESPSLDPREA